MARTSLPPLRAFLRMLAFLLCFIAAQPARAQSSSAGEVQVSWRLLDYIAVDYREAVRGGQVINAGEFQEMEEFSASVGDKLAALPANPAKARLVADADALRKIIAAKSDPALVAQSARALADRLIGAYPVPLAPASVPSLERGARLYADNCASCHGGKGEGPSGEFAKLDPAPIAFADRERARERSVFGLYQVISQGLEGTAMQSFASLPEEDRWAWPSMPAPWPGAIRPKASGCGARIRMSAAWSPISPRSSP